MQLNIDCEGPVTQNDNAFELCQEFIPDGGRFFSIISKYDDFLADVERRPGYKAGDTLKLILPFLKAFGITDAIMEEFSEKTLVLLPGSEVMLPKAAEKLPTFIISTSYRPYLQALCKFTGFPLENIYCTEVSLDRYDISESERERLREMAKEIASMKLLDWPENAGGMNDLAAEDADVKRRLDEIFWDEIAKMDAGRMLKEVNPVGGVEKARAVEHSLGRTGNRPDQVIYAGDSITDVQALELVRDGGGMAIAFNGNRYAIKAAEWAAISPTTAVIGALAECVEQLGVEPLADRARACEGILIQQDLVALFHQVHVNSRYIELLESSAETAGECRLLLLESIQDLDGLIAMSEAFRKTVRGKQVGDLG